MGRGKNCTPDTPAATRRATRATKAGGKGKAKTKKQSWWDGLSPEEQAAHLAERKQTVDDLKAKLNGQLENLTPEQYQQWLANLPHMHRYSLNNYLLIMLQLPEATRVQSASSWKKEGRFPAKGSKALRVLGPRDVWVKSRTETDENGEPAKRKITVFTPMPVFDISQTTGPDGESAPPSTPSVARGITELRAVAEAANIQVFDAGVDGPDEDADWLRAGLLTKPNANGFYTEARGIKDGERYTRRGIALRAGLSEEERLRVLAHEVAHHIAGHLDNMENETDDDRARKELEAETVAYVIAGSYGVESDYSPHYLTNWSRGEDARKQLQAISKGVQAIAKDVFSAIDAQREADEAAEPVAA